MVSVLVAVLIVQTKVFKETAKVGVPTKIGYEIFQGGKPQDWGNYINITYISSRIALSYPYTKRPILAESGCKLAIFNVTLTSTSRTPIVVGGDTMPAVQAWEPNATKKINLVNYFDPKTHSLPDVTIHKGQSATVDIVVSLPATFSDFRVGFAWMRTQWVAWLDLTNKIGKLNSVFSPNGIDVVDAAEVTKGSAFDLGPLNVTLNGALEGGSRKGAAASTNGSVFGITVENPQLAPCRWGWQYIETFMIMSNGSKVGMYPTLYNSESGDAWIGDLAPGKKVTSQMTFSHDPSLKPVAMEIAWVDTTRKVRIKL